MAKKKEKKKTSKLEAVGRELGKTMQNLEKSTKDVLRKLEKADKEIEKKMRSVISFE